MKTIKFWISMVAFLALSTFLVTNGAIFNLSSGDSRDSSDFIDDGFWSSHPSSGDIIRAIYGSENETTAYTRLRSGYNNECSGTNMKVIEVFSGLDTVPTTITGNTILVLNKGTYTSSNSSYMHINPLTISGNCNAIIGKGDSYLKERKESLEGIESTGNKYTIFDNLILNRTRLAISNSESTTIHNIIIKNTLNNGYYTDFPYALKIENSKYTTLESTIVYNNTSTSALFINASQNTTINNCLIQKNNTALLSIANTLAINNSLIEGNTGGFLIENTKLVSNNSVFSNNKTAITITDSTNTGYLNTTSFIKNETGIYQTIPNQKPLIFYGKNTFTNNISNTGGQVREFQTANENTTLGRSTGSIAIESTQTPQEIIRIREDATTTNVLYNPLFAFPLQITGVIRSGNILFPTIPANDKYKDNYITQKNFGILETTGSIQNTESSGNIVLITSDHAYYIITQDNTANITTGFIAYSNIIKNFLTGENGTKNISVQLYPAFGLDEGIFFTKTMTYDTETPLFTGFFANNSQIPSFISGSIFNTGIKISFADKLSTSSATLDGNPYSSNSLIVDGTHSFIVSDNLGNNTGITFTIDTQEPTISSISPLSGSIITGQKFDLEWMGNDDPAGISEYTIRIENTGGTIVSQFTSTGTKQKITTLDSGIYVWSLTGTDKAGNISSTEKNTFTFIKPLTANIQFSGDITQDANALYTNTQAVKLLFSGNKAANISLTGDITNDVQTTYTTAGSEITINVNLTGGDGVKTISWTYKTGSIDIQTGTVHITLDQTAPKTTLISPSKNSNISGKTIQFVWSSTENNNIKSYELILNNSNYSAIWSGTTTGISINTIVGGNYTWYIRSTDIAGNTSLTGGSNLFTYDNSFPTISGAIEGTFYTTGRTITISGATTITINNTPYTPVTPNTNILLTGNTTYNINVTNAVGNSTGITFAIDSIKPVVTGTLPLSGQTYPNNTNIFQWNISEINSSGSLLEIYAGNILFTGYTTNNTSKQITLPNGTYTRKVSTVDKAGNTGETQIIPFTIKQPLTVSISPQGIYSGGSYYIPTGTITITGTTNMNAMYEFSGANLIPNPTTGTINNTQAMQIILTGTDGIKNITRKIYTGDQISSGTIQFYLINQAPLAVTGSFSSGQTYTTGFTQTWYNLSPNIVGYSYAVSNSTNMIYTGYTTSNSFTLPSNLLQNNGVYYYQIASVDIFGRKTTTNLYSFNYIPAQDTTPNSFSFDKITNATTRDVYESNKITISGMSTNAQATGSVSNGTLYVKRNGNEIYVGNTGLIQNGDIIRIELIASKYVNETVSSTLTIGDFSTTFSVKTNTTDSSSSSSSLSSTKKLQVQTVYNALKDLYTSSTQQKEFFTSLYTSLKARITTAENNNYSSTTQDTISIFDYLSDLITSDYNITSTNSSTINTSSYTAPNGKTYTITYSTTYNNYGSPNLRTAKYFTTRDELISYIARNNGGTSTTSTSTSSYNINSYWGAAAFTAPNGKVYHFFKTTNGEISAYEFNPKKFFTSLQETKNYISSQNKKRK